MFYDEAIRPGRDPRTNKPRGLVTSGGRVMGVCAVDATIEDARKSVYETIEKIGFEGKICSKDIGDG